MKQLKYSLLFVGAAGIIAGTIGLFLSADLTINLTTISCGSCLIYGYHEIDKKSKSALEE